MIEECTRSAPRGLGVRALAAAMYLMVAGGPYGLEELIAKVGFGRGLAILAVVPIIWAMPVAMMAAELAAAIPEEGGYYAWVRRALGPFWGAQEAWLSFAASLFDMGIYPALFVAYLSRFWPPATEHPVLIGVLFVFAGCAVNLAPIGAVGEGGIALTSLLLLPFVLLVAGIGLPMVTHGSSSFHAPPVTEESSDFLGALLIGLWNFMGWDNGTTVEAEQGSGAQRTFPRAIFLATMLVGITYMIPAPALIRGGGRPVHGPILPQKRSDRGSASSRCVAHSFLPSECLPRLSCPTHDSSTASRRTVCCRPSCGAARRGASPTPP